MSKCNHEWFSLRRLFSNEKKTHKPGICYWILNPHKTGLLVKCANCEQQKELWEDN